MYLAMILSYLLCYLCMYSVILLKFVWVIFYISVDDEKKTFVHELVHV